MSFGELLYLLMRIGAFSSFALVLGYMSHPQNKLDPEMLPAPAETKAQPAGAVHA